MPRKGEEEGWPAKGAKRKKGRAKTGQFWLLMIGGYTASCRESSEEEALKVSRRDFSSEVQEQSEREMGEARG